MSFARAGLVFGLVGALLAGCGGSKAAPTLSNLTLASSTIHAGDTLSAQVTVSDPDGLAGLKIAYSVTGPAVQPEMIMDVTNVTASMKEAPIAVSFQISPNAPAGAYTLKLAAIDNSGNRSPDLTTTFTIQ